MRISKLEREISHKIWIGKYETIVPTLRLTAELDEGDSPEEARRAIGPIIEAEWNKIALQELRMAVKRNGFLGDKERVEALMASIKESLSNE